MTLTDFGIVPDPVNSQMIISKFTLRIKRLNAAFYVADREELPLLRKSATQLVLDLDSALRNEILNRSEHYELSEKIDRRVWY